MRITSFVWSGRALSLLSVFIFMFSFLYLNFQISYIYEALSSTNHKIGYDNSTKLDENNIVLIYNRVPKTASTTFVGIAYDLCKKNNFHVIHINVSSNNHVLSLNNQFKLAQNISQWISVKPALYHGHFAYIDFEKYGAKNIFFINLIRKPLDRMVSYYYFLRYGDNFRPHLVRKKHGNTMTFDECVSLGHADCHINNLWLQVPFFCGHAASCWKPGNKWALSEAKRNLIRYYFLVGVTEELSDFVRILEGAFPKLFTGALDQYFGSNKSHLRQTMQKQPPSKKTESIIKQSDIWQMENDFYEFALDQFHFLKKLSQLNQKFFYEKIRPK